ncbi:Reductase [Hexamita inflata]|uniref:Reductase n=1 Tax=Hexamita inflata TaxID=28002 RepID=A0ABP1HVZ0_9EUKA
MKIEYCILALLTVFIIWLNIDVNINKRYKCKYVVVTGATGGLGKEIVKQMSKTMNVIALGRNSSLLNELVENNQTKNKIMPFIFDFSGDLSQFTEQFDSFLEVNHISRQDIGMCFSNAGIGEFSHFEQTSLISKLDYMHVNFSSHLAVSDYFCRLFKSRNNAKSALILTSSLIINTPTPCFTLYHASKTAISALGLALFTEYRNKIDILVTHPSSIGNTNFMKSPGMKTLFSLQQKYISNLSVLPFSVSPLQIHKNNLKRVGKIAWTNVGLMTDICSLLNGVGRNAKGLFWSLFG